MMKNPLSLLPVGLLAMVQPLFAQWAPERHPMYDSAAPHEAKEEPAAQHLQMAALGEVRVVLKKTDHLKTLPQLKLGGWRGERCSGQVLLQADGAAKQLTLSCAGLVKDGGQRVAAQVSMVRYTKAHGSHVADVIGKEAVCDNPAGVPRVGWVQVDIPADAQPGVYRGEVVATAVGCEPVRLPVELTVAEQTLPQPKDWTVHLDLWQHPQAVARWHDVEPWSEEHFALMRPIMKRLAEAGQKSITCTLLDEAWSGQTYDWFPSMVKWIRGRDGVMRYDFSAFDKWVHFMHDEIGITEQISCYTMIPWHLKVRYWDESTGEYADMLTEPGKPSYADVWGPFVRAFRDHLKTKGWLEKTCIGIDERPDAMVRAAMQVLQENAPEFRIASAVNAPSALTREVYNISPIITHAGTALGELLKERRAARKKTTFYVCLHPQKPNTFTFSPPAEAEWIGYFAAANHLDGFLRWAYNSWNRNPFETTDFVHWPSGDCFLVYPGNLSSVRFERLRDGLEAYEKINSLRRAAGENHPAIQQMNERLQRLFTVERSKGDAHANDVREARQIVEETAAALLK